MLDIIFDNEQKSFSCIKDVINYVKHIDLSKYKEIMVSFNGLDIHQIIEFVNNNLNLTNANITIDNYFEYKDFAYLIKNIRRPDKVLVYIKNDSYDVIFISEIMIAKKKIDRMVKLIKSLNLSPLEETMFAYDLVKDKRYNLYRGLDRDLSRNPILCLNSKYIVCLGYANVFNWLLTELNISADVACLDRISDNKGHAISRAYIKDGKYNYCGILLFDITFDSFNDEDGLNNYIGFGLTYNEYDTIYDELKFRNDFRRLYDSDIQEEMKRDSSTYVTDNINLIAKLLSQDKVTILSKYREAKKSFGIKTYSDKDLMIIIKLFNKMLCRPLSYDKFKQLLYNVRKNEYYLNPIKYDYNEENMSDILKSKLNIINYCYAYLYKEENRILRKKEYGSELPDAFIFPYNYYKNFYIKKLDVVLDDELKDMKRLELTRILRNYSEKQ